MLCCFVFLLFCAGPNEKPALKFEEKSTDLGIRFQHQDGRSGERYFIETAASSGGWFDYDKDGDLDCYLVNGALTPKSPEGPAPRNRLFENRDGRFVDVTEKAGVGDTGYGMGVCMGDYDSDGWLDIFITNYGSDKLYRNLGNGRFEDVTEKAGVGGLNWGTGAAFGDLDGDGDLDLYVGNYVHFDFDNNPSCSHATSSLVSYCEPAAFKGQNDYLYINQGDGSFKEEALQRGIKQGVEAKSFGVVLSDIDEDGDLDILVACDGTANRFYLNDGKGYFQDEALFQGLAFNGSGVAEAGMGMDVGDVDGDGRLDVFVTNYAHESNTLYLQRDDLFFEDATISAGLVAPSLSYVGWGTALFDGDNDGDLDLAVANGHVIDNIAVIEPGVTYPQPNQIFINDGKGRFQEVPTNWQPNRVSRGLIPGDFDNDGRIDLLITNTNDGPELLHNQSPAGNWIGFQLKGPKNNPFAIGARLSLTITGSTQQREIRGAGNFMSQGDLRAHFGLGEKQGDVTLKIRWLNGTLQTETFKETGRYHVITYKERP